MKLSTENKRAFSLIELSIVIIIISILLVGTMSASIVALDNAKYKVTRDRMQQIYKALGNYLLVNKALPCPASILELKTSANYGIASASSGSCDGTPGVYIGTGSYSSHLAYGMVPTQTLGLSSDMAEDGFGSKITYIVSSGFTDPSLVDETRGFGSIYPAANFNNVTEQFITIKQNSGAAWVTNSNEAIFVLISHGSNKKGAFNSNSNAQNELSSDVNEQNNYAIDFNNSSNPTANFYNINNYFTFGFDGSDEFDDVVFYKSRNAMVMDFNAMSLIACGDNSGDNHDDYIINSQTFTWPQAYYNQIVAANETCVSADVNYNKTVTRPTKRCGAFGIWQEGAIYPCGE